MTCFKRRCTTSEMKDFPEGMTDRNGRMVREGGGADGEWGWMVGKLVLAVEGTSLSL